MKFLCLLLSLAVLPMITHAARPDLTKMSCREATGFVDKRRVVLATTGRNTYTKVAASRAYCASGEADKIYVGTIDNPGCQVGFHCAGGEFTVAESGNGGTSIIGASAMPQRGGCQDGTRYTEYSMDSGNKNFVCDGGKYRLER